MRRLSEENNREPNRKASAAAARTGYFYAVFSHSHLLRILSILLICHIFNYLKGKRMSKKQIIDVEDRLPLAKMIPLSIQHVFAMREVLTPEQQAIFDTTVVDALTTEQQ